MRLGKVWFYRRSFPDDTRSDMRLLELAVLGVQEDLTMEEIEDVNLKFGRKGHGKPDTIRLRRVRDGEAQAGDIGAEQGSDGERNLSSHCGGDQNRLPCGSVDVGVAAPAKVILVFRAKRNVKDVSAVEAFAANHAEDIVGLVLGCQRKEACVDAIL